VDKYEIVKVLTRGKVYECRHATITASGEHVSVHNQVVPVGYIIKKVGDSGPGKVYTVEEALYFIAKSIEENNGSDEAIVNATLKERVTKGKDGKTSVAYYICRKPGYPSLRSESMLVNILDSSNNVKEEFKAKFEKIKEQKESKHKDYSNKSVRKRKDPEEIALRALSFLEKKLKSVQ